MTGYIINRQFIVRLRLWYVILFLCLILIGSGCQNQSLRAPRTSKKSAIVDPVALRSELRIQMDESFAQVISTASDIAVANPDRRIRENTLRWKMRFFDGYLAVLAEEDPRVMFLMEWTAMVHLRQYVTQGPGKENLGSAQPTVAELAEKLEADILAIGYRHFSPEVIEAARDDIEADARRYSWETPLSSDAVRGETKNKSDLLRIIRLPLLPISTMENVSNTPGAINRFTNTASDFSLVVQHLPERTRWQLELLSLEMETSGPVAAMIKQADRLDQSLREISQLLQELPAQVRGEFEASLAATEKLQPEFRATLTEAQAVAEKSLAAMETAQQTTAQAEETAQRFTETAQAFEQAAAEIRMLLADFKQIRQDASTASDPNIPQTGSRVEDYRKAAEGIAQAAGEIRAVLADLQQPFSEQAGLYQTTGEFRGLVNHIFGRSVMLVLIVFVLAIIYKFFSRRHAVLKPEK